METGENKRFVYEFGKFVLDPQEKTLFADGLPLHLPAKEFETLLLLVENNGKALSKEEMMTAVWQDAFVEEANLAKQISRLRKIFNANGENFIETLPKHGYRFSAEVRRTMQVFEEPVVIEKRTVKKLTVKVVDEFEEPQPPLALPTAGRRFFAAWRLLALCLIILLIGAAVWFFYPANNQTKINSIAVLPLKSLTAEERSKALTLGLTDALITRLGSLRQVTVRPISSVAPFVDAPQDSLEIGRKLNVDAVLEGTIQQDGNRLRINVRLLRTDSGEQIWAEKFDGEFTNIFDVQEQLSEHAAQALMLKLGGDERARLTKRYTNNVEAFDDYVKGRYFWNKRTKEGFNKAIEHFNQAIIKDPNYALAYAGLADSYSLLADYSGALPGEAYDKARSAALKALELDEGLTEAHTSLAYVKMYYYRDWQGAESGYRKAIALNPNYATAHQWYSEYLAAMGRFEEALDEIRRAREIDPLSPSINAGEVWILYFARRYDEAIEQGRKVAEMNPEFPEIHEYLKRCYDQKGLYREAVAARQMRRKLAGYDATETAALKDAASAVSAEAYWRARLQQEIEDSRRESIENFDMAEILAQLGEKEQAFEWLERAYEERNYAMMYLKVAPNLDPLRSEPKFADLLRRMNLIL